MGKKLHTITKTKLNRGAPLREEDDTISQGTSSVLLECILVELEELAQARNSNRMITEELTLEVLELQERINSSMMISTPEHARKERRATQEKIDPERETL